MGSIVRQYLTNAIRISGIGGDMRLDAGGRPHEVPTAPLSDHERTELGAELAAERDRVADQLAALVRTFDELVAAADLEPPDDEHDPDGTTAYERAQVTSLAQLARAQLADLDRALAAVTEPAFGTCEACDRPIGLERLRAVPGTRLCVACAASGTA
jgi:DnaK suppressor protein